MKFSFVHIILGFIFMGFDSQHIMAQNEKLYASFNKDTIKIGEEVKFAFCYTHPKDYQVIFPDTTYDFSPFELVKKRPFTTATVANNSVDSVVYYLRTFKVQSFLQLRLPVIIINEYGDSTVVFSAAASVILKEQVGADLQKSFLKNDTAMVSVQLNFNYPYFLIFGIGGLASIFTVFVLFRKNIIRRYRLYVLRKSHLAFLKVYERLEKKLLAEKNISDLELAIGEWKIYLSRLETTPINTYTTTEIIGIFQNEELANTLQELDRSIYGSDVLQNFQKQLNVLKRFSVQRFQKKKKEVRNA